MWRFKLPETIEKGTSLESIVEVKGMPNRVRWTCREREASADENARSQPGMHARGRGGYRCGASLIVLSGLPTVWQ
ncbi:hypothetical protein NGTWS0302_16390 [Mycolicibacterium cyprinidarum]|uniref:Uncharacterized protein n=1 Tax=Mycolicibacterium cyprinidarum TaxID=2860311 RepID=A0ABQ4VHK3_9MYCO|nr:hypothetical protein NGTWS1702_22010 [Mycolicibacterium sp. NGTWSNA01]GJF18345.1 hypothetical protein NGTWS0302_16390 [Mycolicibacterium sp. NGTWS0302]